MAEQRAQQKVCGQEFCCKNFACVPIVCSKSPSRASALVLILCLYVSLRSVCLWEQDVAKKHKKDVRFEIDVVEDLLPVDVEEGAMRGK